MGKKCLGWCPYLLRELLDKLEKRICRTVGPSLAAYLEPSSSKCEEVISMSYDSSKSSDE